jgi:hypothetical protein
MMVVGLLVRREGMADSAPGSSGASVMSFMLEERLEAP